MVSYSGMNGVVANALFELYNDGFVETLGNTIENVVYSIRDIIVDSDWVSIAFSVLAGITAALMIVYFFIYLEEQLSHETFSFGNLLITFIKLIACVAAIVCAQEICTIIAQLGAAFVTLVNNVLPDASSMKLVAFLPADKDEFIQAMNVAFPAGGGNARIFKTIGFLLAHPLWTMEALIVEIISLIIKLVGYFLIISSAVVLLVRVFFAPIGIANIFGRRSQGSRYFFQLLSSACSFAAMLAIVAAASMLSQALIKNNAMTNLGLTDYYTYSTTVTPIESAYTNETAYLGNDGYYYNLSDLDYDETTGTYTFSYDALVVIDLRGYTENITKEQAAASGRLPNIVDCNAATFTEATTLWETAALANSQNESNIVSPKDGEYIAVSDNNVYFAYIRGAAWEVVIDEDYYYYYTPNLAIGGFSDDAVYCLQNPTSDKQDGSANFVDNSETAIENNISLALSFRMLIWAIIPQVAAIGGMAGASRIIYDAFASIGD